MKITVIGAGNGGQAMAAHLSLLGHEVTLYTRSEVKAKILRAKGGIRLEGCLNGTGHVAVYTSDLAAALRDAKIIMVATVANAHREMAIRMAPHLQQGQIVVLNPGRTGGAFEFRRALDECRFRRRICLVEAQTLVYACRLVEEGAVNIVGVKDEAGINPTQVTDFFLATQDVDPDFAIYNGDDVMLLPTIVQGAMGLVSGGAHIFGHEIRAIFKAFAEK